MPCGPAHLCPVQSQTATHRQSIGLAGAECQDQVRLLVLFQESGDVSRSQIGVLVLALPPGYAEPRRVHSLWVFIFVVFRVPEVSS